MQQLRRGKVQASAERLQVATRGKQVAQAKVNNLNIASLADENVLNLQVAVDDAVAVTVVESAGNLSTELAGLLLLKLAVGDDVVEHLAAIDKLEEHIPVVVCANYITQAANVGVVEEGDDGSFTGGANLFRLVGALFIGTALMVIVGRAARNYFAGDL